MCPFCTAKTVVQIFHSLWGIDPQPTPSGYAYAQELWLQLYRTEII